MGGPSSGMGRTGWVLGVLGASGGVGSSTLVSALALRCAAAGRHVVAVDGDPWGAGLDLRLGLEQEAGLRWPDIRGIRGEPDGAALLDELPRDGRVSVVSWDRSPPREVLTDPGPVVRALAEAAGVVVCDLPRAGGALPSTWLRACDQVVMVLGGAVDGYAAASVVVEGVRDLAGLVLRQGGGSVSPEWLSAALGHSVLAELATDAGVHTDLVRGAAVGSRGPVADCADAVLAAVLPARRAGA